MDISIVIVNYNVKDFLAGCLKSIREASAGLEVEVIVVDNNSSDNSVPTLRPLFPDVDFIALDENIGFGRANNLGFSRANGKYILILNPDTILEEKTLRVMYDYMESNAQVGIAGCKVLNPDGTFQLACRRGFPTPWASFSKLFGLQKLFPGSKFFARYNQTFRSIDETYYVDAVIGAFMFARRSAITDAKGFDPDFFMYGEDIDLCFRVQKAGLKIAYVHTTSIIHFKGESTKRSSINEIGHFYDAMRIFATKHYGRSAFFLLFLKSGIILRSAFAYLNRYRRDIALILLDSLAINFSLLVGTKIRFGNHFGFPDYAYPTVFIVITLVFFMSMLGSGEYFESKHTVRRTFFALMVSFFFLSSLTYFFKDFAFSRGVLLMTIGLTTAITAISRGIIAIFDTLAGRESDRNILIVGLNSATREIIDYFEAGEKLNFRVHGIVTDEKADSATEYGRPVLGSTEYLPVLIRENKIGEVIVTDPAISGRNLMKLMTDTAGSNVRFHIARDRDELLSSRIISDIADVGSAVPKYNITTLRYRIVKRAVDLSVSTISLTLLLPLILALSDNSRLLLRKLIKTLKGQYSIVGLYPVNGENFEIGKPGIIGLAHISDPEKLSRKSIVNLNEFYAKNYSISLDLDIFLKYLFRFKRKMK